MAVIDLVPAACTVELAASLHSQDRSRPLHAPWRMATDRSHEKTRRTRDDSSTLKRGGEQSGSATSLLVTRSGTPPVEFRSSSRRVVASLPVDVRLHSASRKSSVWLLLLCVCVSVSVTMTAHSDQRPACCVQRRLQRDSRRDTYNIEYALSLMRMETMSERQRALESRLR